MAVQNGVYETATGDLLAASPAPMVAGAGETLRADVPVPALVRYDADESNMHNWDGDSWEVVAQPAAIIHPQKIPVLTTTQRDAIGAIAGMLICNSTTSKIEFYNGAAWVVVGDSFSKDLGTTLVDSAQATVDIEGDASWWDGTYDKLIIHLQQLVAGTDNQQLRMRSKVDGSYLAGAADYVFDGRSLTQAGETLAFNAGWNYIPANVAGVGSERDEASSGTITIHNPGSILEHKHIDIDMIARTIGAATIDHFKGTGCYRGGTSSEDPVTDAMTGLRLYLASGNIDRVQYKVEGITF